MTLTLHAPSNIRSSRKRMKAFEANISELAEWKLDRDFRRNFDAELSSVPANDGFGRDVCELTGGLV